MVKVEPPGSLCDVGVIYSIGCFASQLLVLEEICGIGESESESESFNAAAVAMARFPNHLLHLVYHPMKSAASGYRNQNHSRQLLQLELNIPN